ncbi:hypothetical protein GJQ57_01865 [Ralstonia pickettii]|uniref:Uncharacterized protein n=1 Tax=Ralstonia pickettii TaxID=329 RepID=A0A7X2HIZ7_RALPI|nr:hypothetical protein [Ralstonia pickettii]MRS97393.1 hypothetical protein [Ralstonia pickettii]
MAMRRRVPCGSRNGAKPWRKSGSADAAQRLIGLNIALAIRASLRCASVMARHHDHFIDAAPVRGIVIERHHLDAGVPQRAPGLSMPCPRFYEWLRDNTGPWI